MTPWLLLIALYLLGAVTCAEYPDKNMVVTERRATIAFWPLLALVYSCLFLIDFVAGGINSDEDHE